MSHQQSPDKPLSEPAAWNPYAPTVLGEAILPTPSDEEQIRRQYLTHEISVQSVGSLLLLGGLISLLIGVSLTAAPEATAAIIFLGIGCIYFAVGYCIHVLQPWARYGGIVISIFGLAGFPVGTIISGYFLYLLASKKGRYVFSDEYAHIRAATPHVRYRTPLWLWCLLGLFILALATVVVLVLG